MNKGRGLQESPVLPEVNGMYARPFTHACRKDQKREKSWEISSAATRTVIEGTYSILRPSPFPLQEVAQNEGIP